MDFSQDSDISPISVIGLVFAIGNLNLPALTCIFHLCQFLRALRPSQKFFYSVSSDIY